jgi:hypothetical protein
MQDLTPQEEARMPSFNTPDPISASVDVVMGDVRITAGDGATTTVDVQPSDASNKEDVKAAELTRVDHAGNQVTVRAPKLRSWRPRSDGGSIAVTIQLPAGSQLRGAGQVTDFHADGRLGDCAIKTGIGQIRLDGAGTVSLKTGIGDIAVDHVQGDAEVTAGSGDVRLREVDGGAVVKNSNGDTWVGIATGELRIGAANGRIAVDVAHAGVVAKSSNGDVRVGKVERGTVVLETSLGDLEVGIAEGTAAWLDVRAAAGKVHNALDAAEAPDPSAETVEVRARTSAGDVVIRRP